VSNLKRFPKNDCALKTSSYLQEQAGSELAITELRPHSAMSYTAPGQIPPRKGKKLVIAAVLAAMGYGAFNVWNTYFRYESHGVVAANVVGVFSPIEGKVQKLEVTEGMPISMGSYVAKVTNSNDYRELLKIEDEIEVTQSEIKAKESENRWNRGRNNDTFYEATGQLTTEEGQLAELKAKLTLQKTSLTRIRFLKGQGAVSQLDLDKAEADVAQTQALISGKTNTVTAMKYRIERSRPTVDDDGATQIVPLAKKLEFLKNEKKRLEDKVAEGEITSPVSGIVSSVSRHAGERIGSEAIFYVVEDNSTKLVLYYNPAARVPQIGEEVSVWSPSLNRTVDTTVIALSRDTVSPPDQIKRNFSADEKLIKVYLNPKGVDITTFIVGSTIKRPSVIESITGLTQIANFFTGEQANASENK
jgi:multidrug resistance efflux pump